MPTRKPIPKRGQKKLPSKVDRVKKSGKVILATTINAPIDTAKLFDRMHEEMIPLIQRYTAALLLGCNKKFYPFATGTFFHLADSHFLVTASHVIKRLRKYKRDFGNASLWVENGGNILPVGGDYCATKTAIDHSSTKHPLSGDDLDTAIWRLDKSTVSALTKKSFLTSMDVCSGDTDLASGLFYLAGWPCEWCKVDMENKRIDFRCMRFITHPHPDPDKVPDFNRAIHVALSLGSSVDMPNQFEGISGCSIWKLSAFPLSDGWSSRQAKVVAVQTGVCTDSGIDAIKGTSWQQIVPTLEHDSPEIAKAVRSIIRPKAGY